MLWNLLPVSLTLSLMVKLWIAASLMGALIVGLGLRHQARKRNRALAMLIEMQKHARARVEIPLLTRVK